jgi:hypothetical protein
MVDANEPKPGDIAEHPCPVCQSERPDLSKPCPHCGSPAVEGATEPPIAATGPRRTLPEGLFTVRASDIEPYVGLRYLSKLFRLMAIILLLLLVAEVITGFVAQGSAALPTLLGEASRLVVLAGLLWGAGDLAILLIDVGHDVRAARILLGRQAAHHLQEHHREMKKGAAGEHMPDRVTDHHAGRGPRA